MGVFASVRKFITVRFISLKVTKSRGSQGRNNLNFTLPKKGWFSDVEGGDG